MIVANDGKLVEMSKSSHSLSETFHLIVVSPIWIRKQRLAFEVKRLNLGKEPNQIRSSIAEDIVESEFGNPRLNLPKLFDILLRYFLFFSIDSVLIQFDCGTVGNVDLVEFGKVERL